jgi:hypothetical protein
MALHEVWGDEMSEALATTEGSQVAQLLQLAVDKNLDLDKLEKLIALQERVMDRQAGVEFAQAFAEFQRLCPPIRKTASSEKAEKSNIRTETTRVGTKFSYNYPPLDEIARTVNPILGPLGLSYRWDSEYPPDRLKCTCTLSHSAGHKEIAHFECPLDKSSVMNGPQQSASTLTYARRGSLIQVLGLTSCDPDTDGVENAACITEDQAATLHALIDEVDAKMEKFCAWLKVASLGEIKATDYKRAVAALEERRRKG